MHTLLMNFFSDDIKNDYLVTLTVIFILQITISDFVAAEGISVSQTHLVFVQKYQVLYNWTTL